MGREGHSRAKMRVHYLLGTSCQSNIHVLVIMCVDLNSVNLWYISSKGGSYIVSWTTFHSPHEKFVR